MSSLLLRHRGTKNVPKIFYDSVRWSIRGYWPEPVTQQTLSKFLEDINYFEEPKKFINIGLDLKETAAKKAIASQEHEPSDPHSARGKSDPSSTNVASHEKLDELINKLSVELEPPPLNYDDARIRGRQLGVLALHSGIYRDLFGSYEPDRDFIKFTPEQAERLNLLVPHHWLTDQPKARVEHCPKEPEPTKYFEPIVDVAARFVRNPSAGSDNVELVGDSVYYGNIIAACDALEKPSITLDGRLLNPDLSDPKTESQFDNWATGRVELVNFPSDQPHYYTAVLLNLDSLHKESSNLHWMLANIRQSTEDNVIYDEVCDYLPVFGIRGFGFSRKFDARSFLDKNQAIGLKPVGLSWFQTIWDQSSNNVFHHQLKMKAPTFEHIQAKHESRESSLYPGKLAFNNFLDYRRTKKSINEQVLLERLKSVDPFNYKDQYVPPRVPPTVFQEEGQPSWMHIVNMKKKNRIGYWRGLRPASALLPLDNNADLDYPSRPLESSNKRPPEHPNHYRLIPRRQELKDMPVSLPPNEHQAVFVQEDHEVHLGEVMKVVQEFRKSKEKEN